MPTRRNPHKGSMQYWPRKRARRVYARVRSYPQLKEANLLGFAGYKVGMTHLLISDNRKTSDTKEQDIFCPVTIVECPPIKIISVRFYKRTPSGLVVAKEVMAKGDKSLSKKIRLPKKENKVEDTALEGFEDIRVLAQMQPQLTGIGKKKADLFEMQIGGDIKQKFEFAKNNFGKEIKVADVLKEGQQVDTHAITKGKGFQGPVKRFGVSIRQHKSEKTKRGPGNVGPWHGNRSWTVAHAGQTGYHQRMEHNKWVVRISNEPKTINAKGGFLHYGNVKKDYVLLKGSIAGPARRAIRMVPAIRANRNIPSEAPSVSYVSLTSRQG